LEKSQGTLLRDLVQIPEGHLMYNYMLSPSEEITWRRLKQGDFQSDIPNEPLADDEEPEDPRPILKPLLPEHTAKANPPHKHSLKAAKDRLAKRQTKRERDLYVSKHGPQGERLSAIITGPITMLPLDQIIADKDFKNVRLDATNEELQLLIGSMRTEGLKIPIVVIPVPGEDELYYLRSGFRRTEAALFLQWHHIPAIILPSDLPEEDEYWANILENSTRQNLHTYEIALAAKTMSDNFHISYRDFAQKAGYSDTYIDNLLRALDRLPDCILEKWKQKDRIPVNYLFAWAAMMPDEAISSYNVYAGLHPRLHIERISPNSPPTERPPKIRNSHLQISSMYSWKRMRDLRSAVEQTPKIGEEARKLCLQVIDYCQGATERVPGIYDHRTNRKGLRRDGQKKK